MAKRIYLWSDIREKSLHQVYIVEDYREALQTLGYAVTTNQTRNWKGILDEVYDKKPDLFFLHGGKIFPPEVLKDISKKCKVYLRWRWHPDPPVSLMQWADIASKVSFIKNTYNNKLFYSPHPAIRKYFHPQEIKDEQYKSRVIFIGLADSRGQGFYERSGRNAVLASPLVRYLNRELYGNGNTGFYEYPEIAKYYCGSKIALSVSSFHDEVNFRVFNAMSCKTAVISDRTPAMDRHFKPYVHYIPFDKSRVDDFEKMAERYLNDVGALRAVASAGYFNVASNHCSGARLSKILKRVL